VLLVLTPIITALTVGSWERWTKIVFFIEILYFIASLRTVGPKDLGAILLFGKPLEEVGSGLQFVPLGISSLVTETALTIQNQYPAEPEKVDKTDTDTLAPGKVFPMRVTHAAPEKSSGDPIDERMTTEVSAIARFKVKRGEFICFLTTIGSISELERTIRDTVEGGIKKEFAKRTPSRTLAELTDIDKILKDKVTELTEHWGVEISDVQIVDVDLGKTVNKALRDLPAARRARQVAFEKAEADKVTAIKVGEGAAAAKLADLTSVAEGARMLLEAQAVGTAKLAGIAKLPEGQVVLWLDTMRAGFEKSNHTIIPGGELFTAMSGVSALLQKAKEEK